MQVFQEIHQILIIEVYGRLLVTCMKATAKVRPNHITVCITLTKKNKWLHVTTITEFKRKHETNMRRLHKEEESYLQRTGSQGTLHTTNTSEPLYDSTLNYSNHMESHRDSTTRRRAIDRETFSVVESGLRPFTSSSRVLTCGEGGGAHTTAPAALSSHMTRSHSLSPEQPAASTATT